MACLWQKVSAEDWDLLGLLRAGYRKYRSSHTYVSGRKILLRVGICQGLVLRAGVFEAPV